jgi:hypothetical protein
MMLSSPCRSIGPFRPIRDNVRMVCDFHIAVREIARDSAEALLPAAILRWRPLAFPTWPHAFVPLTGARIADANNGHSTSAHGMARPRSAAYLVEEEATELWREPTVKLQ